MAYTKGTLSLLSQTLEGGQKWWSYTTADSIATVLGAGYISNLTCGLFNSSYQNVFAFAFLILMLVFRPSGILRERVSERA